MKIINLLSIIALSLSSVFSLKISLLKGDTNSTDLNITDAVFGEISKTILNLSNQVIKNNDIIFTFKNIIPDEMTNLINLIEDDIVKIIDSKQISVNIPILMNLAGSKKINQIASEGTEKQSLQRRLFDIGNFNRCLLNYGILPTNECTLADFVLLDANCTNNSLGNLFKLAYCTVNVNNNPLIVF